MAEVPKFINEDVYYNLLKTEWEAEAQTKKPDFFWALTKAYWKRMLKSSSGFAIDMVLQILVGIFAGLFIAYLMEDDESEETGWTYAVVLIILTTCSNHVKHPTWFLMIDVGLAIRQAALRLLHDKAIRMSSDVLNSSSDAGKIINVATTDLDMIEFIFLLNSLWFAPLFFVIVIIAIYLVAGYAGIIGILVISLLVPL